MGRGGGIQAVQVGQRGGGGQGADGAGGVPALLVVLEAQHPAQAHVGGQAHGEGRGGPGRQLGLLTHGGHQGGHDGRAGVGIAGLVHVVEVQRVGGRAVDERPGFPIGGRVLVRVQRGAGGIQGGHVARDRLAPARERHGEGVLEGRPHVRQLGRGLLRRLGDEGRQALHEAGGHGGISGLVVAAGVGPGGGRA
jgi:hypothetical protein